jgi:CRP/FNR family cyclic AMP-dependent transcriptional regulator
VPGVAFLGRGERFKTEDLRRAIVMSTELATTETRFFTFCTPIDSEDKAAHSSQASALQELDPPPPRQNANIFFSDLSEPSNCAIGQVAHVVSRPKGAIMFLEGDAACGVYLLLEGRANILTANAEGKTLILRVATPGDILGLSAILAGAPHAATAETSQPCRFAFIAREDFVNFIKKHSDACFYFAQRLGRDCQFGYAAIRSMVSPVSTRLARFLVSCCRNRYADQGMVRAKLFLNHETIAQHIGCSRETVSRMLSDFKRRGIAELVGTTLLVHDPAALECLSIS